MKKPDIAALSRLLVRDIRERVVDGFKLSTSEAEMRLLGAFLNVAPTERERKERG